MFTQATQTPLRAIAQVFRGTFKRRAAEPWSFGYGNEPSLRDLRHLNDQILKDIGYHRVDMMAPESRAALNRMITGQLW